LEEKGLDKNLLEFIKSTDQKSDVMEVNAGRSFKAVFDTRSVIHHMNKTALFYHAS